MKRTALCIHIAILFYPEFRRCGSGCTSPHCIGGVSICARTVQSNIVTSTTSVEVVIFNSETTDFTGSSRDLTTDVDAAIIDIEIEICILRHPVIVEQNVITAATKTNGTIVSIGTHPSGVLISDLPIDQTVGLCSISTSEYPVSMINMKELDDLMYVKLDILGLDNIGVINDTCKMLGIERLTPDNTDMEDMNVWRSIRDDTTLIFQWESDSAQHYLKQFMSDATLDIARSKIPNFSMLKWMSFGNGLLRPACASFRDSVAKGEFYYYPLEFLTAALNIFGDNMDKTADITSYAHKVGIRVTLPKWGLSRGEYFFDRERKIIAKGLTSIKYMSAGLADELYDLAAKNKYSCFMDLLKDLDEKTSINSRQLDILIKLDFFSDFGNQRELLRMVDLFFNTFKRGQAKQIKKSEVDGTPLEEIVKRYAVGVTKSGGEAKSYTLLDVMSILRGAEDAVKAVGMDDLSDIIKVRNFYDVMGYIGYVSGNEADRRKLYITDMKPLVRRRDGEQFAYSVFTKSIGSGKESRFTLFNREFKKEPVKVGDIIYCKGYQRDGEYFKLTAYDKVL